MRSTKPLPGRVEDLEDAVYGDPNDPQDDGLLGFERSQRAREHERDGILKAARVIALLMGIALTGLTLIEVLSRLRA